MLLLAARVGKAKINELDVLVLDHFQYVGGCSHGFSLEWAKRLNLLRRSGVYRSASKSRNYAISSGPWHRAEQGFAGLDRPVAGIAAPNRFPPGLACDGMVQRAPRWFAPVGRDRPRYTFRMRQITSPCPECGARGCRQTRRVAPGERSR
jgi:hypothetical protein